MTPKSGRAIAWLSFLLGISVSIAGNIGHAASDGMKPGEWAGAAFWPLALMLTIEILTRVRWQPERRWIVARVAGLLAVAVVAAVLSYRHLAGLMTYWGEDWTNSHLGPLAVDGLMLVAATALLSISKETAQPETTQVPMSAPEQVPMSAGAPAGDQPVYGDWAHESQALDQDYLDPPTEAELAERKQEPKSKLHIVGTVSNSDAEEAARQAWIESEGKLSSQQVATLAGLSKSTAHRRIGTWKSEQRRIVR